MNDKKRKIQEGWIKKGGRNPKPSSQRPSKPPAGQSSGRGGKKSSSK